MESASHNTASKIETSSYCGFLYKIKNSRLMKLYYHEDCQEMAGDLEGSSIDFIKLRFDSKFCDVRRLS